MLRAFGVQRVHSAPRVRCRQTVAPLADELGVETTLEPALTDEAYSDDPDAALARVIELAAGEGVAVVSSQGTAIPGIVGDLAELAGLDVGDASTKKAGAWGLGFDGGTLVYADYYPSPLPLR
jgi:8-oxo-dGTP diphosphatase